MVWERSISAIKTLNEKLLVNLAPGTWAAISSNQERLVAIGESHEEALENARKVGESEPFIVTVPLESSALIL